MFHSVLSMDLSTATELTALGVMSGTSRDGIDAAILRTDGTRVLEVGPSSTVTYEQSFRTRLTRLIEGGDNASEVEDELTRAHVKIINDLLERNNITHLNIDIIGFHGHTVYHVPEKRHTWQIGDGDLLARLTQIPVVNAFRDADVAAGGQGAPLAPAYHWALAQDLPKPLAILNLGGVANVTWLGADASEMHVADGGAGEGPSIFAFDTGPGNALLDDWMAGRAGEPFDRGGRLANAGTIDESVLSQLMHHPYFRAPAPKSLDRDAFSLEPLQGLSAEDGAATLVAFTTQAVSDAVRLFPSRPARWLVAGGGRHNTAIMDDLAARLACTVESVEAVGWDGDALEAQAFAFLAVRSLKGWPLSWPTTTGVPRPCVGGLLHELTGKAPD